MNYFINATHWITDGDTIPEKPPAFRRNVLRVARFIEYGGPLAPLHSRETLVECHRRPKGRPCQGLMWVTKLEDGRIHATCPACGKDEFFISGWKETIWAEGPMEPVPPDKTPDEILH